MDIESRLTIKTEQRIPFHVCQYLGVKTIENLTGIKKMTN